ncbi:MAG: PAS domain-containing protein, partial [Alphaproteobacteria bacterium]|nr:PAS domain-containing protein [Alphaproteobacteria bacterium]
MAYRVSTMAGMLAAVLAGALADCLLQAFFAPSPVLTVLLMLFALSMLGVYLFFNASQKPRIGGTAGLHALIDTSLKEAAGGRSLFAGALRRFVSRKQSREMADMMNQLHNSRIFLKNIINHVADPIFVKDRQHRLVEGNSAFWRLMGKAEADVLGKTDYSFFPKDEADVFWEKDEEVFTTAKENINIEK